MSFVTEEPPLVKRGVAMESDRNNIKHSKYEVPLWHKANLSIEEAVAYTGIGRDKLYEMTSQEDCPFVLWVGNRRMIKRQVFDDYIAKMYSV